MKKLLKLKKKAFTLVEMLVVLGIISLLLLIFVPNLSQQKDAIQEKGNAAVVKVVESQMELYELEHDEEATVADLQAKGYITDKQAEQYAKAKK
ncbi:TPA: prepilin-type N-terminal cleavage/methylation domain-containing protein [Streptococcus suis]|uniref:Prepilin-type N-terminal cleavage/methylation domain-containing protein n=2 Tax=Streptococcus suis TaxID=1307 RepID=A0A0Z8IB74_STRSU|nr:competence type IV pilus major pilin ComGC [Streptococcus suis]MCQ8272446.1 prepilin-type N-terminal cleavage/methylation domain-containing protein [Streptococcus suis]MCQ8786038.1 competence type IV pilus major pilin ComGC [Streptococcus suis]MDW8720994.1 competence type IV pilus major pilin ComGC [Streptococcus suis]MDY7597413.1 competence type IV pilus major pilin ComGC [Streptococcus suis]MDY7599463.1 competence type IV pilus major pilin ComGC [Streptococcus suis]